MNVATFEKNLPAHSASLHVKRPTIGVLAGMGPRSTSPFIDALVTACQIELGCKDDNDFPPIMILSWPTPFRLDGSGPLYDSTMVDSITKGFKKLIDFLSF